MTVYLKRDWIQKSLDSLYVAPGLDLFQMQTTLIKLLFEESFVVTYRGNFYTLLFE